MGREEGQLDWGKRDLCLSGGVQGLHVSGFARSVCWGACVRRKQVELASWAEKWLLAKRVG